MGMNFDPMTGEPIVEKPSIEPVNTEQQVTAPQQQVAPKQQFDPMTGQPITPQQGVPQQSVPQQGAQQPRPNFDPMTGRPIMPNQMNNSTGAASQTAGAAQMAGAAQGTAKKFGALKVVGIVAAGLVVVVCGATIVRNAVIGKGGKILIATSKTVQDTPIILDKSNVLSTVEMMSKGKYTVTASVDDGYDSFEGKIVSSSSEKQVSGTVDIDGVSVDGVVGITNKYVKAYIPMLSDDTYVYDYTNNDQDGYIAELLEDEGIDVEDVNSAISQLYNVEDKVDSKSTSKLGKDFLKQFNEIGWEKADKKSVEVDGKKRNVKGYKAEITGDDIADLVAVFEDYYTEQMESLEFVDKMGADLDDVEDAFDEIYDACDYIDDIEISAYMYKGMLAAVYVDVEDVEIELLLKGGDYRLQNLECNIDTGWYDMSFEIEGQTKGTKETLELIANRDTLCTVEYDWNSGKFEYYDDYNEFSGVLKKAGNGFEFSTEIEGIDIEVLVSSDAKFEKYGEKEVDITEYDEEDFEDLVSDFYDDFF